MLILYLHNTILNGGDIVTEEKKDKRPVKCPYCGEKLPRGEAIRHTSGRYYHKECYKKWRGETDHRKQLIGYICELHNIKKPTGMMLMQVKRFEEEFGYKHKGMELTLRYFYETLGNNVREGDGIGIIPYVYEEATEQYVKQMKINELAQDGFESETIDVYINQNKKNTRKKTIDIESL